MAQVAEIILGAAPDFDKIRWQAMAAIFNDPTLCGKYMVKPGDTLGVIAQRCGTTVKKMMALNGMGNANKIRAGQVLILPENAAKGCSVLVSTPGRRQRTRTPETPTRGYRTMARTHPTPSSRRIGTRVNGTMLQRAGKARPEASRGNAAGLSGRGRRS